MVIFLFLEGYIFSQWEDLHITTNLLAKHEVKAGRVDCMF